MYSTYKLPMYLFFYMVPDIVILRRANPLLGPFEGVDPESPDLVWAQMALALLVAISGLKKSLEFRAHTFKLPSKWICPPLNHYVPHHINNRYINRYNVPGPSKKHTWDQRHKEPFIFSVIYNVHTFRATI
jgi:hypothetical protein